MVVTSGRRQNDQNIFIRVQIVLRDEDENVYHSLPKQKIGKNKQVHSLKHSVEMNQPATNKTLVD